MDLSHFAIDTVTLAGPLEDKLRVIRDAGFGGVEIWAKDLVTHPGGVPGAVAAIRSSGLRVTSFQLLKDYEGLDAHLHEYKIDIAESLLDLMDAVGAKLLVVASSTSTYASGDMEKVVAALRWLRRGAATASGSVMPKSRRSTRICATVVMIEAPPGEPRARKGRPSRRTMVGAIEERGRLPPSTLFAPVLTPPGGLGWAGSVSRFGTGPCGRLCAAALRERAARVRR